LAVLVDRAVQIGPAARDLDVGLVHEPPITRTVASWPGSVDELHRERLHPPINRDVIDNDAALSQQLHPRRGRTGHSADTSEPRPRSPHAETDNRPAQTSQTSTWSSHQSPGHLARSGNATEPAPIPLDAPSIPAEPHNEPTPYGLTERELLVLRLLAAGRSDREIGAELFISGKTASVHVSNILRKLGVSSRVQAATLAERGGILAKQ
jgi:DNA-binding CsgD family transcriptional regulator